MKKLFLAGLLLISFTSAANTISTFYSPVVGVNSAKKGIKLYPERAIENMEESCRALNGEIVRYQCATESKESFKVVACSGICKIHAEDEVNILIQ